MQNRPSETSAEHLASGTRYTPTAHIPGYQLAGLGWPWITTETNLLAALATRTAHTDPWTAARALFAQETQ